MTKYEAKPCKSCIYFQLDKGSKTFGKCQMHGQTGSGNLYNWCKSFEEREVK